MNFLGIIPSRYASTRFPGKPLIDIKGKTMIQRVYEQASLSKKLSKVIVATDDNRILKHVKSFGGNVILTSSKHNNGTERCNETVRLLNDSGELFDVVINIQGDEPFIDPQQIDLLCSCFEDEATKIATLIKKISENSVLFNPNRPKVDIDDKGFAKMFSREAIPVLENIPKDKWLNHHTFYKHIGIYGYRAVILPQICKLNPSPLEKKERLEQLRWVENGYQIKTAITTHTESIAVDTPEDLKEILLKF